MNEFEATESECSKHPCAPHGFNRNASHSEDRYVCDCEGWSPDRSCAGLRLLAEVERLSTDIHSCHDQCQREACVLRRELDALKVLVEASPAVEITACNQVQGARDFDAGDMYAAAQQFEVGQRVRLLADPQESV